MKLFAYYYTNYAQERINESKVMRKYKEAYFEAAEMIMACIKQEVKVNNGLV